MTSEEKFETIADILDMDAAELTLDTVLADLENWDSVAVLSYISVMNDGFQKFPNAKEVLQAKTIGDLISEMN